MTFCSPTSTQTHAVAEQNLWCAVIEQALSDIGVIKDPRGIRTEPPSPYSAEYNDAIRWLFYEKADFVLVCTLAGIAPSVVRAAAKAVSGGEKRR